MRPSPAGPRTVSRLLALPAVALAALVLAACSGSTQGTTNITATEATLNLRGSCGSNETCRWYYELWRADEPRSRSRKTPVEGPVGQPVSNADLSRRVTGLSPGTTYRWVACGSPDDGASFACVGPDGQPAGTDQDPPRSCETFTTASTDGTPGQARRSCEPARSPSGSIVYSSDFGERSQYFQVYLRPLEDAGSTFRLTSTQPSSNDPTLSPDGRKIAFTRDDYLRRPGPGGGRELWTMNRDGTGATKILAVPRATSVEDPAWSPDGSKIAFGNVEPDGCTGPSGTFSALVIAVVNADGSGYERVAKSCRLDGMGSPTWSPTGAIAFAAFDIEYGDPGSDDGTTDHTIRIATRSGSAGRAIASGTAPDWSPDGSTIVFKRFVDSRLDSRGDVFRMNPDGDDLRRITADGRTLLGPSWSPSGDRIAFELALADRHNSSGTFATISPDGSGRRTFDFRRSTAADGTTSREDSLLSFDWGP